MICRELEANLEAAPAILRQTSSKLSSFTQFSHSSAPSEAHQTTFLPTSICDWNRSPLRFSYTKGCTYMILHVQYKYFQAYTNTYTRTHILLGTPKSTHPFLQLPSGSTRSSSSSTSSERCVWWGRERDRAMSMKDAKEDRLLLRKTAAGRRHLRNRCWSWPELMGSIHRLRAKIIIRWRFLCENGRFSNGYMASSQRLETLRWWTICNDPRVFRALLTVPRTYAGALFLCTYNFALIFVFFVVFLSTLSLFCYSILLLTWISFVFTHPPRLSKRFRSFLDAQKTANGGGTSNGIEGRLLFSLFCFVKETQNLLSMSRERSKGTRRKDVVKRERGGREETSEREWLEWHKRPL